MKNSAANPKFAALTGLLLFAPFVILNTIVAGRIQPFFSLIRPGEHTSPQEYVVLFSAIFLILFGALLAARPMLQKGPDGKRRIYPLNGIVTAILLLVFVWLSAGLGSDIYRCDVLQIPNCD